ncbi:uncharacterized protein LOC125232021 [Leguminivora glycinivorella]|uniref:uncharacterized protein LOC125232021 n=1 Tax=Leguminivora glycinivorella TaxID=1035111 RepID=UPI00200E2CC2|nr:uncharacterized protein LOC125232021 [Leguminivora glycinivorella]
MDEILLTRLSTFVNNIEKLTIDAKLLCTQIPWDKTKSEQSAITSAKLHTVINRFNTDLYQYFKLVKEPSADDISKLTTSQLEGEEALAELNTLIQQFNKQTPNEQQNGQHFNKRSKLPELTLHKFKGTVLDWYPFWDQFQSSIGQRDLCDVDKLLYLKASLEGEPKNLIDGLETTNLSYQIAVDVLRNRYGKPEQIIDRHYATLYKIKRATKFEECRRTLDEIERHLRVLHSLGENIDHHHLRFIITEKFPEDVIYEVKLKSKSESIQELRTQLDIIINAREEAKGHREFNTTEEVPFSTEVLHTRDERKVKTVKKNKFSHTNRRFLKPKVSMTTFTNTFVNRKRPYDTKQENIDYQPEQKMKKLSCIFCGGGHFNDRCPTYKTLVNRKRKLTNTCFICLRIGHKAMDCRRQIKCAHCNAVGTHNRALCPKLLPSDSKIKPVNTLHVHGEGTTVLQTAVISAIGRNGIVKKCRLLMDSGSQRSYVTQRIEKELNLSTEEENHLFVFTFGTEQPKEIKSNLVRICLKTKEDKLKLLYANVVPVITQGVSCPKEELLRYVNDYDKNLILADDNSLSDRIDILIGNDYYYSFMNTKKIELQENLYLVESEFGWILSGKPDHVTENDLTVLTYFQTSCENKLTNPDPPLDVGNVKVLWELESIGITDAPNTDRDEEAIKKFNETTTIMDNRYVVSWPWNEYPPKLPTNFGLAYGRLVSLVKRLERDALLLYERTLQDQLDKEIIEVVPNDRQVDHPVHFLAHHGISSSEKAMRIVYDASAKGKESKSLNECLYRGPIMLEDLTGLLIKFRCHQIALTADVEKAFLQIGLNENDRDVTRFLWLKDINKPVSMDNLIAYRFTRVPFGIISSPYLLNATIKHHLSRSTSEQIKNLANDIYVDNLLTGVNNIKEATQLYNDCKTTFKQISMNIREWNSNCKELGKAIPEINNKGTVKTLGLDWNLCEDTLN